MAEEDAAVFALLDAAAQAVNPVTTSATTLTRQAMKNAFKEVEKHDRALLKFKINKH